MSKVNLIFFSVFLVMLCACIWVTSEELLLDNFIDCTVEESAENAYDKTPDFCTTK